MHIANTRMNSTDTDAALSSYMEELKELAAARQMKSKLITIATIFTTMYWNPP